MELMTKLILLFPLIGFIVAGIVGKKLPGKSAGWIATLAVLASFIAALSTFSQIAGEHNVIKANLFNWLTIGNLTLDITLQLDRLSLIMVMVITGIGFLIHLYSIGYMSHDPGFSRFFSYLNLFVFFMLILVLGSNFIVLFFGWEGVGLCSYLLIGFWYHNKQYGVAARKAFIMNRIGDLGLLLGIFMIYLHFGSLEYDQVFNSIATKPFETATLTAICILLFIGAMGKSAQLPLYTWLPDAMAGPTPVSALIHAATMVTAGVYMVVRCNIMFHHSATAQELILITGIATSVFAAIIGLKQNDIKKILAYSTVSQLGLMFIALGVGSYTAAMFHLITHAFFKALLFLGSGSVIHAMSGEQDIRKMGGLSKSLRITYITFLIGTLAIVGFPFFSGFFSKDEILAEVYKHNPVLWFLAVGSAFLTAIYMLRMLFVTFFGSFRGDEHQKTHLHESPWAMLLPLIILAVLSIFGGLINLPPIVNESISHGLQHWLEPIRFVGTEQHSDFSHQTELLLAGIATMLLLIAFIYTRLIYINKKGIPESDLEQKGLGKLISNKFYVDEIYDLLFVKPLEKLSTVLHQLVDNKFIDGVVNLTGSIVTKGSGVIKHLQNGNTEFYMFGMVAGLILLMLIKIIL